MLDWLIIGGGIHGVHVATMLLEEGGVDPERLRILDPHEEPLASWRRCVANTGMRFLRSSAVHHIHPRPWSLREFACEHGGAFTPPYDRPSVSLFERHCDVVIREYGLRERWAQGWVTEVELGERIAHVRTAAGVELVARHVVLAPGSTHQVRRPAWAKEFGDDVTQIFAPGVTLEPPRADEHVVVLGGGISAAQAALKLSGVEAGQVTLWSRHAPRVHQLDSDPGWLGPKYMVGFERERSLRTRRQLIDQARYNGSMPTDVHRALERAVRQDQLCHLVEPLEHVTRAPDGRLRLEGAGEVRRADRIVLATGFAPQRPGGAMVDALAARHRLPCAPCGYPVLDRFLRWAPGLFVTGPLAELELGPTARNIAGARRAGERLSAVAAHQNSEDEEFAQSA